MEESHSSVMDGYLTGKKVYESLMHHCWWDVMYRDVQRHARIYPSCAVAMGEGRINCPPFHPIPVGQPFQIVELTS